MPYNTRRVAVDFDGKPIPQYYDESLDSYEVNKGLSGGASAHVIGTLLHDSWEGNSNVTKNFTKLCTGLYLKNDGSGDVTVTINTKTIKVKSGESFAMRFEQFSTLTINTTSAYRAIVAR